MRVLGVACTGDDIDWALVEGTCPEDFTILAREKANIPRDTRCRKLDWVRREILALVTDHHPDLMALREAQQSQRGSISIERVEVEGVVQAASAEAGVDLVSFHSKTIESALRPYGGENQVTNVASELGSVPASRRTPALIALCAALGQGRRR